MENKEFIAYLKTLLKLEKNLYTLRTSFEQICDSAERVTDSMELSRKRKNRNEPQLTAPSADESGYKGFGYGSLIIGLILTVTGISMDGDFFKYLVLGFGICGLLFAAIFIPIALRHQKSREDYYIEEMEKHSQSIEAEEEKLDREAEYGKHLIAVLEKIKNQSDETSDALEKLYSINIIHPKYQNFIAIASFCEYFETGRCTKLDGYEGAYNIFENEIRLDKVITNQERILDALEQIKNNQYTLYCTMRESQYYLDRICTELDHVMSLSEQTAHNSAITAYNSQCSADNTAALSSYMFWRDMLR